MVEVKCDGSDLVIGLRYALHRTIGFPLNDSFKLWLSDGIELLDDIQIHDYYIVKNERIIVRPSIDGPPPPPSLPSVTKEVKQVKRDIVRPSNDFVIELMIRLPPPYEAAKGFAARLWVASSDSISQVMGHAKAYWPKALRNCHFITQSFVERSGKRLTERPLEWHRTVKEWLRRL